MGRTGRNRKLGVGLASIAVGALVVASPVTPVAADGAAAVDLAISVADFPDPVSPAPGTTVYSVVATNNGLVPVPVDITDTTSGGSIDAAASVLPAGCAVASTTSVVCRSVQLAPGVPLELLVAVDIATDVTNTASVSLAPQLLGFVDLDQSNNTDTEQTSVGSGSSSASYLAEGETLTFKKHSLFVRESATGVITRLADAPTAGVACGTGTCTDGLHIDFFQNDVYRGLVLTTVNLGTAEPCRGLGAPKCNRLFYRTTAEEPMRELFRCLTGDFRAESGPCIEDIRKSGAEFVWDVRMTSDDPDIAGLKL